MIALAVFEEIIDASGVAPRIEAVLPIGVRPRQLPARTLLAGMASSVRPAPTPVTAVSRVTAGAG